MLLWLSKDDRDRLRTALDLGETVSALKRRVLEVEGEWAEVLDKLRAREERHRKRNSRAVRAGAEADSEGVEVDPVQARGGGSAADGNQGVRAELWRRRKQLGI